VGEGSAARSQRPAVRGWRHGWQEGSWATAPEVWRTPGRWRVIRTRRSPRRVLNCAQPFRLIQAAVGRVHPKGWAHTNVRPLPLHPNRELTHREAGGSRITHPSIHQSLCPSPIRPRSVPHPALAAGVPAWDRYVPNWNDSQWRKRGFELQRCWREGCLNHLNVILGQ
jgi:hypothetical protein